MTILGTEVNISSWYIGTRYSCSMGRNMLHHAIFVRNNTRVDKTRHIAYYVGRRIMNLLNVLILNWCYFNIRLIVISMVYCLRDGHLLVDISSRCDKISTGNAHLAGRLIGGVPNVASTTGVSLIRQHVFALR